MATIYDSASNTLLSGTAGNDSILNGGFWDGYENDGDDYIQNCGENVTIKAGDGNDSIFSGNSPSIINSGAGNDSIESWGSNVTINAGTGNDYIRNSYGGLVTIAAGDGNDTIYNRSPNRGTTILAGAGDDSIFNDRSIHASIDAGAGNDSIQNGGFWDGIWHDAGSKVTINASAGNDFISNSGDSVKIDTGDGHDSISNFGSDILIDAGAGDDSIDNNGGSNVSINAGDGDDDICNIYSSNVTLSGTAGNDSIENDGGFNVLIKSGAGDDYICNLDDENVSIAAGKGNDSIYNDGDSVSIDALTGDDSIHNYEGKFVTIAAGDGFDSIIGFKANDTLKIGGGTGTYSSQVSGSDVIVTVGEGKITLDGAASLEVVNIVGEKIIVDSWTLDGTTAAYSTGGKVLATVTGVKSLDGLSVDGKTIKLSGSALSKKVTVSGAYTFDFAEDYSRASITGSDDDDTIIARGKNLFVKGGAGADTFSVPDNTGNVIADYEEGDIISVMGSVGGTSTDGDDLILDGKITVTGGANKNLTYIDELGEEYTIKPPEPVIVTGKSITLTDTYLEDDFNVADYGKAIQTIDASAVLVGLNIAGNKLANVITGGAGNDSLSGGKGNDTLTGGAGSDVFIYDGKGNDVVTDYADEDTIKFEVAVKKISKTKAGNVVFTTGSGKITVKDAGDKVVAYEDSEGVKKYYPVEFSDDGTSVTLLKTYGKDDFKISDFDEYENSVETIDAAKVKHDLTISGNKLANVIGGTGEDDYIDGQAGSDTVDGGKGNDTLNGEAGNDTIYGEAGSDVFVYALGDGKDVIEDYQSGVDTVMIISGEVKFPKVNDAGDVTFKIGSGQLTFTNSANQSIELVDASGNVQSTYTPK